MSTWHIIPKDDSVTHDTDTDDCVCVPRTAVVPKADGPHEDAWFLLHTPLDGRELKESQ